MDNYKIIKYINKGAFGKIYLVERKDNRQKYAMKTIKITGIDRYQKVSILNEIKILLIHNSEFLLKCYDLFIAKHKLCIITEYIDGGDLDQYIKNNKHLGDDNIIQIFLKICVGIYSLHINSIVHRDIKPANILVTKNGGIKICDFGICKVLDYNKVTNTMIGTPYFMSPEQMHEKYYDYKVDVWGIGCVLYNMLYGKLPFEGRSIVDLKHNIQNRDPFFRLHKKNANLYNILKEMLDKNKIKRTNLKEFLDNKSNKNLLKFYNIENKAEKFKNYIIPSVPITEYDWQKALNKIKIDFSLPKIKILNTNNGPTNNGPTNNGPTNNGSTDNKCVNKIVARPPKLVPYKNIKNDMRKAPDIIPRAVPPKNKAPLKKTYLRAGVRHAKVIPTPTRPLSSHTNRVSVAPSPPKQYRKTPPPPPGPPPALARQRPAPALACPPQAPAQNIAPNIYKPTPPMYPKPTPPREVRHNANAFPPIHRRSRPLYGRGTPPYNEAYAPEKKARKKWDFDNAMKKRSAFLKYIRNKDYKPYMHSKDKNIQYINNVPRLPKIKNKFKNVESKVKQYWAPSKKIDDSFENK